jgi:flagellar L-ring protein precursor FlgH
MNDRQYAIGALLVCFAVADIPVYAADLYQPADYRALTSDRRARSVGDVLTVLVVENSSASSSAGTSTDKGADGGVRFVTPNRQRSYGLGLEETFDGSGKVSRTGRLLAQLSVNIVAIRPNGDLMVQGEQQIEINGEKQAIRIEGRVRPVDVSEGNAVLSSRIADSRITYVGDGVLAESQRKGWLPRILSLLGLL